MNMELPEELMTLILSKVPANSLLRFKCVQKSWHSLINSPQFIRLNRSSSSCLIHLQGHVMSFYSNETLEDLGNAINVPFSFDGAGSLSGSCDGLVCITNRINQILICNPTIREFRSLPLPHGYESSYDIDSVALGSDPNTCQYEVLMIGVPFDYDRTHDVIIYGVREARLYDFATDSWRETDAAFPPGPFRYSHRAVSLNGAFHWSPWVGDSDILTFHMSNEVTGLIPLPDFAVVHYNKELFVSSKSHLLSLMLYDYKKGRFEISVMTEYGVKGSWTRIFQIGHLPLNFLRPITFLEEQRLLLITAQGQLVSCGLQHQNVRHFPIDGNVDVCPFSPSLVSVNVIGKSIPAN